MRIPFVNTTRIDHAAIFAAMLADKDERARRLRKALDDAGFKTRKEAAERYHLAEATITSHANGTRAFDLDTGYMYAKKLKVDPLWLLGLRDEAAQPKVPSEGDLAVMLNSALDELPPGSSLGELKKVVATSLRDQLERYLTGDEFQNSEAGKIARGKDAQPLLPTT